MQNNIRWGIIGLGKIAHKFAADLLHSEGVTLQGVASRNAEKAADFAAGYHVKSHYGDYRALAQAPDIDVVYIATPHAFHFELTKMCLENEKAVLCEKPLGINGREAEASIDLARSKNLFLMEGLWTRFIPATETVLDLIQSGAIGDLIFIRADFGFKSAFDPESRLFNKTLGGGSLLDIGIYPIFLSLLTLGYPKNIKATARMTKTAVDGSCAVLFDYANSAVAVLDSTFEADTPTEAYIHGTRGSIKMHKQFHHTEKITLLRDGMGPEVRDIPHLGNGYVHEIDEVTTCLKNGRIESEKLPHRLSSELSRLMDDVKKEIGLSYSSRMVNER
ncbi:MAG: Gfo/Idh/MocA family oxidoreductase [Flavobacteriales bacterium]|nr:Gfo/Idh/MocA family oxidoreductase [Flavobacteriales bacterium]